MNIYVGNLPYRISEQEIRELFEAHGEVSSVAVIMDKFTGQSKGFGFVEMPSRDQAAQAIESLNGHNVDGRDLRVNEARPRNDDSRGGGGGGGGRRDRY
jgi:RNA recognition motif-containing protein